MEFRPIERAADSFQEPVTIAQIDAVCRRVFGPHVQVAAAVELGAGMYNNTYRVDLVGKPDSVVLRFAPKQAKQFSSERHLMRNEYATIPWLTSLAPLMPKVIAADWSHEVVARDYMVQSFLTGRPAPEHLGNYPQSSWSSFFEQIGLIAREVHAVRGPLFGPVTAATHTTWSAAVAASLSDIGNDLDTAGLDSADIREVVAAVDQYRAVLDEITEPRLLAGDLWTVNVMLDGTAAEPMISGVLDLDRTSWGDPAADWTIRMAAAKPGTERDAFWDTYGAPDEGPAATLRSRFYEARHLGAIRLERHRLANSVGVRDTYPDMAAALADVA